MQIGSAALVVVQMHMAKSAAVRRQQLTHGTLNYHQIGVTDVQMEAKLGKRIEQFSKLLGRVEVARQILQHETDAPLGGVGQKLAECSDVLLNEECPVVHRSMPIRMHVHPAGTQLSEHVDTTPQLYQGCSPDL